MLRRLSSNAFYWYIEQYSVCRSNKRGYTCVYICLLDPRAEKKNIRHGKWLVACVKGLHTIKDMMFLGKLFHLQKQDTSLLKSTCTIPSCDFMRRHDVMEFVHSTTMIRVVLVHEVWTVRFSNTIFTRLKHGKIDLRIVCRKKCHILEQFSFIQANKSLFSDCSHCCSV